MSGADKSDGPEELVEYIVRLHPADARRPFGIGEAGLSLRQCPACFALVVEDFMPDHQRWHEISNRDRGVHAMTGPHPYSPYKVRATFTPQRTDDLQNDAEEWIGRRLVWTNGGVSGDDEPYPGEVRWSPVIAEGEDRPKFAWTPECDLSDIEVLEP